MEIGKKRIYKSGLAYIIYILLGGLLPLQTWAQESDSGLGAALESLRRQEAEEKVQARQTAGGTPQFSWKELWLDLPPDTVLATMQGKPILYADEFNQRVKTAYGADLETARYQAIRRIVDAKILAERAREEGFGNDPTVVKRLAQAEGEVKAALAGNPAAAEVTDAEAQRYYKQNIEQFRLPDRGTRVVFVVKDGVNEIQNILKQIKKGEPIEKFGYSPDPVPGSWLPEAVQKAVFHLEPGQFTEWIATPGGLYIAKLVERNAFDHFKVSVIIKKDLPECEGILKKIEAGAEFEAEVAEKEQLSVALDKLPKEVRQAVPDMELKGISRPISTPLGCFLVKLQERWSEAEVVARVIRVDSEQEGKELLARLKPGSALDGVNEREMAGKDLPVELREAAKRLKEGEYSVPVKTGLGYYLVKVQKRLRPLYRPFGEVEAEVKKMVKADRITDKAALKYYNKHKSDYAKPGPDYMVDIILCETPAEGEQILAELQKSPSKQDAIFAGYQKNLKEVSADKLPAACQSAARKLSPGQISPVITTEAGRYILRLNKKADPAYLPFEDVQYPVKCVLSEQAAQEDERGIKIYMARMEEEALGQAYYKANVTQRVNTVPVEEAEGWWQGAREQFFHDFGIPESAQAQSGDGLFKNPEQTMLFKKSNALLAKYNNTVKDLYTANNVVIYENLLR